MTHLNTLVVLFVAAILFAGCSQQASQINNPPPQPGADTEISSTPETPAQTPPDSSQKNPEANPATTSQKTSSGLPKALEVLFVSGSVQMAFFRYGEPRSFEYRDTNIIPGLTTVVDTIYSISEETLEGKETLALTAYTDSIRIIMVNPTSNVTSEYQKNMTSNETFKIWFDKDTKKCLKTLFFLENNGRVTATPEPCQTTGEILKTPLEISQFFQFVGKETVTVPAGTYNCDKYISNTSLSNGTAPLMLTYYWVSPDIYVPIKMDAETKTATQTFHYTEELVSYTP